MTMASCIMIKYYYLFKTLFLSQFICRFWEVKREMSSSPCQYSTIPISQCTLRKWEWSMRLLLCARTKRIRNLRLVSFWAGANHGLHSYVCVHVHIHTHMYMQVYLLVVEVSFSTRITQNHSYPVVYSMCIVFTFCIHSHTHTKFLS